MMLERGAHSNWTLLVNGIGRERKKHGRVGEGKEEEHRDEHERRRETMSLQPQKLPEIPEETARIARILFPKGNRYLWLRDELGAIYNDEQFSSLYPKTGQLAEQPWRFAVMSIVQYLSLIHISEPTRLGMISYAVFCLKKKKK